MKSQISSSIIIIGLVLILSNACNKNENISTSVLTTTDIIHISHNSVSSGGNITSDGGSAITSKGVCWSSDSNPTIEDNITIDGSGNGNFTSIITGLSANTRYYVRAYATNSVGTAYGNEENINTMLESQVADYEGNVYNTITIGSQVWMVENLKTTKYNDGTVIPLVDQSDDWYNSSSPGYCWFNNDKDSYKVKYGALYNWYTVNTGKLCPTGWHVATDPEWTVLTEFLGGQDVAGGKLKETGSAHWLDPNTGASDEVGFAALPGGSRFHDRSLFKVYNSGSFNDLTFSIISNAILSDEKINGSNNSLNEIPAGAIVIYKTDESRYGKFQIVNYDYNITLNWVTYNSDGTVYSSGNNLFIHGTYFCDLDAGVESAIGEDFFWQQVTSIERYIAPHFGSSEIHNSSYIIGYYGYWWSSTDYNTNYAWNRGIFCNESGIFRTDFKKQDGFSVRCVQN